MAKVDIGMCAGCLRYYGGWADKIEGKVVNTNSETFNYTVQEPVSEIQDSKRTLLTCLTDRCLRSDYPVELPTSYVGLEDWPGRCLR